MAQLTCQYQRLDKAGGNFVENNFGMFGTLNYLLQVEPNPRTIVFGRRLLSTSDKCQHYEGNKARYLAPFFFVRKPIARKRPKIKRQNR